MLSQLKKLGGGGLEAVLAAQRLLISLRLCLFSSARFATSVNRFRLSVLMSSKKPLSLTLGVEEPLLFGELHIT